MRSSMARSGKRVSNLNMVENIVFVQQSPVLSILPSCTMRLTYVEVFVCYLKLQLCWWCEWKLPCHRLYRKLMC